MGCLTFLNCICSQMNTGVFCRLQDTLNGKRYANTAVSVFLHRSLKRFAKVIKQCHSSHQTFFLSFRKCFFHLKMLHILTYNK